jgi:hypothetical protein
LVDTFLCKGVLKEVVGVRLKQKVSTIQTHHSVQFNERPGKGLLLCFDLSGHVFYANPVRINVLGLRHTDEVQEAARLELKGNQEIGGYARD